MRRFTNKPFKPHVTSRLEAKHTYFPYTGICARVLNFAEILWDVSGVVSECK